MKPYLELAAVKVEQPLGDFYAVSIPADKLKTITFSSRAKYKKSGVFSNVLSPITGTQRELSDKREKEIARFINTAESALPNSIILGANVDEEGRLVDTGEEWYIRHMEGDVYKLVIPTNKKMASIIDGQHRLNGTYLSDRKDMQLLCSVYVGLHVPYHAYLFATINANQKKVDRSLAYELYGFGLDNEPAESWSPEKISVYITRKLNVNNKYLKKKIILGALSDVDEKGLFSLAAIVDSIMSLFSSNPKKDRDEVLYHKNAKGRQFLTVNKSSPPLREAFIKCEDNFIEKVINKAVDIFFEVVIKSQNEKSFVIKTVGLQAYFKYVRSYMKITGDLSLDGLRESAEKFSAIDFSDDFYTSSGIGEGRMFNIMCLVTDLKKPEELIDTRDYGLYVRKLSEYGA